MYTSIENLSSLHYLSLLFTCWNTILSVSDLIHNVERRKEWDKQFTTIEVVEEHKNFRVMYWLVTHSSVL